MFKYYYKVDSEENCYYVYLDNKCTQLVAKFYGCFEQDTLIYDLENIIFIYKGEIK